MKHIKKRIVSAMVIATLFIPVVGMLCCDSSVANAQSAKSQLVSVPAGVVFPAVATMELSSDDLLLGQSVTLGVSEDFYYNNILIVPIGSSVNGTVIQVKKSDKSGVNGELLVNFTNIITPYGQMIPVIAKLQTEDGTGLLKGGVKKERTKDYTKDAATAAASGALAGAIFGPLDEIGNGARYGAAVGAGMVAAKSVSEIGQPAVVPVGTKVNIVLKQQITFKPQQNYR